MQVWHQCNPKDIEDQETLAGIVRVPLDLLPLTCNCLSEPAVLAKGIGSCFVKQKPWSEQRVKLLMSKALAGHVLLFYSSLLFLFPSSVCSFLLLTCTNLQHHQMRFVAAQSQC